MTAIRYLALCLLVGAGCQVLGGFDDLYIDGAGGAGGSGGQGGAG